MKRAARGSVNYLEGYGQLWDEMPEGDIPLAHARGHPSYCVDCKVAQYANTTRGRASFIEQHQEQGHRVFDPLINWPEAPDENDRGHGHGEEREPMATATAQQVELREVLLTDIDPNPWQPRTTMDWGALQDLQEEILAVGLLQEPMARHKEGRYQLAFGHRRIEAVRGLNSTGQWGETVTLKVRDLTDREMAFIALAENRAREDLTPAEEIHAWAKALREIDGLTIQSLADAVRVDRTTMSKNLAIVKLPQGVMDLIHSGQMSLRAAREFLCLVNDDHSHDDMIAMVLKDLTPGTYQSSPPDYRLKTVRKSIRGLRGGVPALFGGHGFSDAQRSWRPLEATSGPGGRGAISFDAAFFEAEHSSYVHVLPEGDESGGSTWTCAVKQWASWSSRATREANRSPEAGKSSNPPSPGGISGTVFEEWWKAVKRDPIVKAVVGNRLRGMKSAKDLTEEDIVLLGTRVERPRGEVIALPREAQPAGVKLANDVRGAPVPPMFDFSKCATCIAGASWDIPPSYLGTKDATPRLVCTNQQAWLDKRSVGMQQWVNWKTTRMAVDAEADAAAIERLQGVGLDDAEVLVKAMLPWFARPLPMQPLSTTGSGWEERSRHNYWPAGAIEFSYLTGVGLPDAQGDWRSEREWTDKLDQWHQDATVQTLAAPGSVDWSRALACLQVWQVRVVMGLGAEIWGPVAPATLPEPEPTMAMSAAWEPSP